MGNQTLIEGLCYSACTPGTIPFSSDPTFCVATTPCQPQTTQDIEYNICNKVQTPLVGTTCDVGYTEWLDGYCFVNCNYLFIENGTTCIKKTYFRDSVYPATGPTTTPTPTTTTSTAVDDNSTNNWLFIICILLLIFVFIIVGIIVWRSEFGDKASVKYLM